MKSSALKQEALKRESAREPLATIIRSQTPKAMILDRSEELSWAEWSVSRPCSASTSVDLTASDQSVHHRCQKFQLSHPALVVGGVSKSAFRARHRHRPRCCRQS